VRVANKEMKIKFKLFFLLLIPVLFIYSGTDAQRKHSKDHDDLTEEQRINLTYNFYNANKEKILGNLDKAADLFAQCLRIDPHHAASMYELANIYMDQKKATDALFFAKEAAQEEPDNVWYQLQLAEIYQTGNKYEEAAEIYENLIKNNPQRIDFYFDLAQAHIYRNKIPDAIKVYDKLESIAGVDKELSIQKERLYLKLNKVDKAAAELEKLISKDPEDLEAYSLLVELYQVNNQDEKAFEVIKRMQVKAPNSAYVYLALAEYYRQKGEKEKSFENLKLAFAKTELESEVKIKVLASYLPLVNKSPDMMEQSLELAKILTETHPSEAAVYAVYGDFLTLDKKFDDARKSYRSSIAADNKNFNVWQQLLITESDLNDFSAMLSESEEALTLFPSEPIIYLLNGIAKAQNKNYEDAIKSLLAGSKMVVDNDVQLTEFYSRLGDNYNALKNYTESDKYYDKALVLDPKNANILNNYSYYLSLRDEKLEKAAEMSKLSNSLVENNSSYQDTYAWVLYKLNKLQDAKEWLEKALSNGGDKNDTILEHYGDLLFKMGQVDKAYEYWQKAKSAGPGSDQLLKKIADKKLYE
jgi:tetratricopeptide (TPR) repeat protein